MTPADAKADAPADVAEVALPRAGMPCAEDSECGGLTCEPAPFRVGGACGARCVQSSDPSVEQAACGGEATTCLTTGLGSSSALSFCTRACDVAAPVTCTAEEVCTSGYFYNDRRSDRAGCMTFCHGDDECPGTSVCDRQGYCAASLAPSTNLADGQPCDPTRDTRGAASRSCLGVCRRVGEASTEGLCVSYIDLHRPPHRSPDGQALCPDNDPGVAILREIRGRDNIALCFARRCRGSCDCPAGLRCGDGPEGTGRICTYPSAIAAAGWSEHPCDADGGADGG